MTNVKRTIRTMAAAVAAALLLAGCGTPDPHEPAELQSIRELVKTDKIWSTNVDESLTGLLTPAVTENVVYAAGGDTLQAVDLTTGDRLWKTETGSDVTAGVGTDGRLIALGTAAGELQVYDTTGKLLWNVRLSSEMSVPPLVGGGFVIVRTTDTRVTAFDAETGERRWHYQSQVPALTVRAPAQIRFSPAGVLVGQSNGRLLALNARGETVFDAVIAQPKGTTEVERLVDVVGAPMVDAQMMCAAAFQGNVVCMSSRNGRLLWSAPIDAVTGPVSDGVNVYVVDAEGVIHAFDYATGRAVWTNSDLKYRSPSAPGVMGRVIVVGDYDGEVHLLDSASGEIIGRTSVSGAVKVPPVSLGDRVLIQTDEGRLTLLGLDGPND